MNYGPRLSRSFFDRPCLEVARDLVGAVLVHDPPSGPQLAGQLVEVEAYLGEGLDPASHAHTGKTQRNGSMFETPGRIYAYRSYGIHTCINVVCERRGAAAAVLLRAAVPLAGRQAMCQRRGLGSARDSVSPNALRKIASGPGRLAEAFGLTLEHDGVSTLRGPIAIRAGATRSDLGASSEVRVATSTRIGITRGADLRYRFYDADSSLVSPWRPSRG